MKKILFHIICFCVFAASAAKASAQKNDGYFELKVYHFNSSQQESLLDKFVMDDLIPYLHKNGISSIGVFKALTNDTARNKKMYVFIPFKSLRQWEKYLTQSTKNDPAVKVSNEYTNVVNDEPAYDRVESIFLRAFKFMPKLTASKLTAPKSERIYELRSYESASEKLFKNKVHMFNEGGEIDLFARLGFNAVFYGEVIYGAKMPNLMYMTSFENMKARGEHWSAFGLDPAWKTLSAKKEYQKNVSKIEITFLKATEYSDL